MTIYTVFGTIARPKGPGKPYIENHSAIGRTQALEMAVKAEKAKGNDLTVVQVEEDRNCITEERDEDREFGGGNYSL